MDVFIINSYGLVRYFIITSSLLAINRLTNGFLIITTQSSEVALIDSEKVAPIDVRTLKLSGTDDFF